MVLLTMTPSMVDALSKRNETPAEAGRAQKEAKPTVEEVAVGKPISHGQIIELWEDLMKEDGSQYSLESLLRGARVYIPPPPPKPEPTAEYKLLMARLRHEAEERSYQRMASHQAPSFAQQYPNSSLAHAFSDIHRPPNKFDEGDDTVAMDDAHRQVMLVLNFLLTILGCAGTLWVLARWWSTPARLFLTLGGSTLVGIAEVGLYQAYLWHLGQAKKKGEKMKETKEIIETWVVGRETQEEPAISSLHDLKEQPSDRTNINVQDGEADGVRHRKTVKKEEI